MGGPSEEGANERFLTKLFPPGPFRSNQRRDHQLVVCFVGMLTVEADLDGQWGRIGEVLTPQHLGLVMLTGWLRCAFNPNFDAMTMMGGSHLAEVRRCCAMQGVGHVLK